MRLNSNGEYALAGSLGVLIGLDNAGRIWFPLGMVGICTLDGESFDSLSVRGTPLYGQVRLLHA